MPNLRKYSGTRLLEAVAAGQQGYEFGDRMVTNRANRNIALADSARREDANQREEDRQPLVLEGLQADIAGQKGRTAATAQEVGERQRSEQTRLSQLEATLGATQASTEIAQAGNRRQEELQGARVRSGRASASAAEAQASSARRKDQREAKTSKIDDQAALLESQGIVQSLLTANARGYAESLNLPMKLQTEEMVARVDNQLAAEKLAIKMATSKDETQENIAMLNAQALEGANRTLASLATHRPEDALRYARESPNFGLGRDAAKVVRNGDKVEVQDAEGNVVKDSVRDAPAVYDFKDLFAAADLETKTKEAELEYLRGRTAKALGGTGTKGDLASGLTPAEERARFDDIVTSVQELDLPDGVENVEQYRADIYEVIARDPSKYNTPPAVVALNAKKHVETLDAKKMIEGALSEAGIQGQVSPIDILRFVEDPANGVSSPTDAVPLILERYIKAAGG